MKTHRNENVYLFLLTITYFGKLLWNNKMILKIILDVSLNKELTHKVVDINVCEQLQKLKAGFRMGMEPFFRLAQSF